MIFNGAEPISVALCNEFMSALAYTGLEAPGHVSGLRAGGSLARGSLLPPLGCRLSLDPGESSQLSVGVPIEVNPADPRDALELMCVGHVVPNTEICIADDARAACPTVTVGHILIRGPSVTRGYFGDPEATARGHRCRRLGGHGRSGRSCMRARLYIAGRSKEIIFVNGQNYYPYDLENIASARLAWI